MLSGRTTGVVDDEAAIRAALDSLLGSLGCSASLYPSADAFLASARPALDCLILDVNMPGMGGLELQAWLVAAGDPTPVIFMTAHLSEPLRARALKMGALCVLGKPVDEEALLRCIDAALGEPAA